MTFDSLGHLNNIVREIELDLNVKATKTETRRLMDQLFHMLYTDVNTQTIEKTQNDTVRLISLRVKRFLPTIRDLIKEANQDDLVVRDLCKEGMSKGKILVCLAYLMETVLVITQEQPHDFDDAMDKVSKIVSKQLEPWIMQNGGWQSLPMDLKESIVTNFKPVNVPNVNIPEFLNVKLPMLIMVLMLVLGVVHQTTALVAYDCSKPRMGKIYSLMDLEECPEAYPTKFKAKKSIYHVYQEVEFQRTMIRECIVRKATFVYYCGRYSYTAYLESKLIPRPMEVHPDYCAAAFTTNKLRISPEIELTAKKGVITHEIVTLGGKIDYDGSCTGRQTNREGSLVNHVIEIQDYQVELREFEGIFETSSGKMQTHPFCTSKTTSCFTGESLMLYNVRPAECDLIFLRSTEFEEVSGERSRDQFDEEVKISEVKQTEKVVQKRKTPIVLVSESKENAMRFVRKEETVRCSKIVYQTNYKGIVVSKELIHDARKLHVTDIKPTNYLNNKMDFLYHLLQNQIKDVYRETIINDCKLNRDILRNRFAILINNPSLSAPMLLPEKGVFARMMGEVLYSYKCAVIDVQLRRTTECTNELPVVYEKENRYVEPVTRRLIEKDVKPKIIECNPLMSPIYKAKEGVWMTIPDRKETSKVENLEITKLEQSIEFEPINDLAKGGIYTEEDIEEARRNLLFPVRRERIIRQFVETVMEGDSSKPNYELILGPDHYHKAALNFLKRTWGRFTAIGNIVSTLLGFYMVFALVKLVIAQCISTYALYKAVGFTWKLITGCLPFLAKFVLIENQRGQLKKLTKTVRREPLDDNLLRSTEDTESGFHSKDLTVKKSWTSSLLPSLIKHSSKASCPLYPNDEVDRLKSNEVETIPLTKTETADERAARLGIPRINMIGTMYGSKLSFIPVRINGYQVQGLVDSGADVSLVKYELLTESERQRIKPVEGSKTITGDRVPLEGKLFCDLELAGSRYQHDLRVMRNCPYDVLLGVDILSQMRGLAIDLSTGNLIPVRYSSNVTYARGDVFVTHGIEASGRAETVAYLTVMADNDEIVHFEPNERMKETFGMDEQIVRVIDKQVPIKMVNFDVKSRFLRPNTKVGKLIPVEEDTLILAVISKLSNYPAMSVEGIDLPPRYKDKLKQVWTQFQSAFAQNDYDMGHSKILRHQITLTDDTPIKQRPYRIPYAQQEEVDNQLHDMLQTDVIQPSTSPWLSPMLLVKKKDGTLRFCIDFRKVNEVTRKNTYPLPNIEMMFDRLKNSVIFSVIDLQKGYHQVEMDEKSREITAFSTGKGLYEFLKMPFGLTNAPATFQRMMNLILMDVAHAMVYLDDIIIFSSNVEDHINHISDVLERLQMAGLKIKPTKCDWAKKEVRYVGHIVSREGVKPDPANVAKVVNYPIPNTVLQVQEFLGLTGYYRRFIKNYANIAEPLYELLRGCKAKGNHIENLPAVKTSRMLIKWGDRQQNAFQSLKDYLVREPILRYPDMTKPFLLMTDASGYAIGAVLSQIQEGEKDHAIAYASRGLKKHERNYSTIEKEALAIVFAVKKYRHYLWGRKIILYTDHSPLQWLLKHRDSASKLIRWALVLQEFDIEIRYRTGKANANADALSRMPQDPDDDGTSNMEELENTVLAVIHDFTQETNQLLENQHSDEEIQEISQILEGKEIPRKWQRFWRRNGKNFVVDSAGVVKYRDVRKELVVVPASLRKVLLFQYHDGALGGHLSARKTLSRLRHKYFWKNINADVTQWCRTCAICRTRRNTGEVTRVPLQPISIIPRPMEFVAIDILGPLPESIRGNIFILVFSDYLTRWVEAYAITDQKAETIARIFVEEIVFRYGAPRKLVTDQGRNFMSTLLHEICKIFDILKLTTSPYRPQADGLVERFNRTLLNMLASYTNSKQNDWDLHINSCLFAYRNAVHEATGETPFYLMYMRDNNMPIDLEYVAPSSHYMDVPDYKVIMQERMQEAWKRAGLQITHHQEGYKELYDRKAKPHTFKVGDKVMVNTPQPTKGLTPKLQRTFKGPYVVEKTTPTNLQLKPLKSSGTSLVVHANRCKHVVEESRRYNLRSRVVNNIVSGGVRKRGSNPNKWFWMPLLILTLCAKATNQQRISKNIPGVYIETGATTVTVFCECTTVDTELMQISLLEENQEVRKAISMTRWKRKVKFTALEEDKEYIINVQWIKSSVIRITKSFPVRTRRVSNPVGFRVSSTTIDLVWTSDIGYAEVYLVNEVGEGTTTLLEGDSRVTLPLEKGKEYELFIFYHLLNLLVVERVKLQRPFFSLEEVKNIQRPRMDLISTISMTWQADRFREMMQALQRRREIKERQKLIMIKNKVKNQTIINQYTFLLILVILWKAVWEVWCYIISLMMCSTLGTKRMIERISAVEQIVAMNHNNSVKTGSFRVIIILININRLIMTGSLINIITFNIIMTGSLIKIVIFSSNHDNNKNKRGYCGITNNLIMTGSLINSTIFCSMNPESSRIKYVTVTKDRNEYHRFSNYLNDIRRTFVWFREPKQIPNVLKGKAVENRQLLLGREFEHSVVNLSHFITDQTVIELSAVDSAYEVFFDNNQLTIYPWQTLQFHLVGNNRRIELVTPHNVTTDWVLEVFEEVQDSWARVPRTNKDKMLPIKQDFFWENKSCLRKSLSCLEQRQRILFLDAKIALSAYAHRPLPLAVIIANYQGEIVYHEKITPRGKVINYRFKEHGLLEESIINRKDESVVRREVNELIKGALVIGHNLAEKLFALRVTILEMCGWRDLSNAIVFDNRIRRAGRYRLAELAEMYAGFKMEESRFRYTGESDVLTARRVYLAVETNWKDHLSAEDESPRSLESGVRDAQTNNQPRNPEQLVEELPVSRDTTADVHDETVVTGTAINVAEISNGSAPLFEPRDCPVRTSEAARSTSNKKKYPAASVTLGGKTFNWVEVRYEHKSSKATVVYNRKTQRKVTRRLATLTEGGPSSSQISIPTDATRPSTSTSGMLPCDMDSEEYYYDCSPEVADDI